MRKFIVTNLIVVIMAFSFIAGYTKTCSFSYASTVPDGYTQVTTQSQLTDAFLAYCKSRDSEINGVSEAVSTFTYSTLVDISNALGISLNDVQSELYYLQQNNGGFRYYMTTSGVTFFNNIFAYLIQNEGLEVGQPADKELYSGQMFTDRNGNSCFVYNITGVGIFSDDTNRIIKKGSVYLYDKEFFKNRFDNNNLSPVVFPLPSGDYSVTPKYFTAGYTGISLKGNGWGDGIYAIDNYDANKIITGFTIVYTVKDSSTLNLGYLQARTTNRYPGFVYITTITAPSSSLNDNVNITFVSNNISNSYEGDTIINNEGDIINSSDPDDPSDPSDPDDPTPPTPPTPPNIPGIELPDLSDLNSVNLFLDGLKDKFPFSIPWDMYLLLAVLNAPPEAPHFEGTVDFKIYQWNYDLDFSEFEQAAQILRALELLSFTMGLILITRNIIRG